MKRISLTVKGALIIGSCTIVAAIISGSMLFLTQTPPTDVTSIGVKLTRIGVDTESCLWKQIYQKDEIIGFSEDTIYLWNKWRWPPDSVSYPEPYIGTEEDYRLQIVYAYLQQHLTTLNLTEQIPNNITQCEADYLELINDSYDSFRAKVILTYLDGGPLFSCLKRMWPQEQEFELLKKYDYETYEALYEFQMDFFRDSHPIFDIIIENSNSNSVVIHSASLDMRKLSVDTFPKAYGGQSLEIVAEYDWKLTSLEGEEYKQWLNEKEETSPYFGGYFRDVYNKSLPTSYLDMTPPLLIPPKGNVRFGIRFTGGYGWPCEIRFSFYYGENQKIMSKWFLFEPTQY